MRRILLIIALFASNVWGAISNTPVQVGESSGAGAGAADITFGATATSGNLLTVCIAVDRDGTTGSSALTVVSSGWTTAYSVETTVANDTNGVFLWKLSDGTETDFDGTLATGGLGNASVAFAEYPGTDLDLTAVDTGSEDESNIAGSVTSQGTGTTGTPSQADALAISCHATEALNQWNISPTAPTNYTEDVEADSASAARAGAYIHSDVLSAAATQNATLTTSDSGGEAYGAVIVFVADAGPALTCASSTVEVGSSVTCTAASTIGGTAAYIHNTDTSDVEAGTGGTTTALTFTPTLAAMVTTGDLDNTNIEVSYAYKICDDAGGTNCSGTDSLTITGPVCTPPNCTTGAGAASCDGDGSSCPDDSDFHDITCPGTDTYPETGDNYVYSFSAGDGEGGDSGAYVVDTTPATIKWYVFDEDSSPAEWCGEETVVVVADTVAPVLSSPSMQCSSGLCNVSVVSSEPRGEAWAWIHQDSSPTVAKCEANGVNRQNLDRSPINFNAISIEAGGNYKVSFCQDDAVGNAATLVTTDEWVSIDVGGCSASVENSAAHSIIHPPIHPETDC